MEEKTRQNMVSLQICSTCKLGELYSERIDMVVDDGLSRSLRSSFQSMGHRDLGLARRSEAGA
jgi:hypothetical protein